MWNLFSNRTIKNVKNLNLKFILFIFILSFSFSKVNAVEITNFSNIFAGITGMIDSKEYGLVFSNSLGLFKLDKKTGVVDTISINAYHDYKNYFDNFFEFAGEIYFYRRYSNLYCIRNGVADSVSSKIASHFVKDSVLYLTRIFEPKIQILHNNKITGFKIGEENQHASSSFAAVNDEIFCYFTLNNTNNAYILKISESGIEYIFDKKHPEYTEFKKNVIESIHSVNNELWINTRINGNFKISKNGISKIDTNNTFFNKYLYCIDFIDNTLIGINGDKLFKYNFITNEETFLRDIRSCQFRVKGRNKIYYILWDSVIVYDFVMDKTENIKLYNNTNILKLVEDADENIIIAKSDSIEWYKSYPPKFFAKNTVFSNKNYGITYDVYNKKIVVLGELNRSLVIQTFDGKNWEKMNFNIPNTFTSTIDWKCNIESDLYGNYLISNGKYMYKWDGVTWELVNFLKNPNSVKSQTQNYNVLFRDSTGGVWVDVQLREYSEETNENVNSYNLWRFKNNTFENMFDYENTTKNEIYKGICLRDGTCIFDALDNLLIQFKDEKFSYYNIINITNSKLNTFARQMFVNYKNQLIFSYFTNNNFTNSILICDLTKELWDDFSYDNIINPYISNSTVSAVFFDGNGKNWLVNSDVMLRIDSLNKYSVFRIYRDDMYFSQISIKCVQVGNTVWKTTDDSGITKFTFPGTETSVEENISQSKSILKSELIFNSIIELNETAENYSIYTINGELVDTGKNCSLINSDKLESGTYFLVIPKNNGMLVNKFVVVK
jgi:hypothetical protein